MSNKTLIELKNVMHSNNHFLQVIQFIQFNLKVIQKVIQVIRVIQSNSICSIQFKSNSKSNSMNVFNIWGPTAFSTATFRTMYRFMHA
jgi:hypothetical protein